MECSDSSGGLVGCFFLFSFYYYSFIHFNKHTTTSEHSSVHLSLAMHNGQNYTTDMYYLCTHNNYTTDIYYLCTHNNYTTDIYYLCTHNNYTTDIYYLCTHNNYTKRYKDSHADTGTYRQAIGQAHCKQSHTDICLERFTVLTD